MEASDLLAGERERRRRRRRGSACTPSRPGGRAARRPPSGSPPPRSRRRPCGPCRCRSRRARGTGRAARRRAAAESARAKSSDGSVGSRRCASACGISLGRSGDSTQMSAVMPGVAQLDALVQRGDAELTHAARGRRAGHLDRAVAVGVGLDHEEDLAVGADRRGGSRRDWHRGCRGRLRPTSRTARNLRGARARVVGSLRGRAGAARRRRPRRPRGRRRPRLPRAEAARLSSRAWTPPPPRPLRRPPRAIPDFQELRDVLRRLRGPDGCPWDREQTLSTLTPYLIEEAYEILDAVAKGDADEIAEELGDTLFLVISSAPTCSPRPSPHSFDSLCRATAAKLRRRHPHVFGDTTDHDGERLAAPVAGDQAGGAELALAAGQDAGLAAVAHGGLPHAGEGGVGRLRLAERRRRSSPRSRRSWQEVKDELAARGADTGPGHARLAGRARATCCSPSRTWRGSSASTPSASCARPWRASARASSTSRTNSRSSGSHPTRATLEEMDALWDEAKSLEKDR